jgi:Flp pilus assembly protein TadD
VNFLLGFNARINGNLPEAEGYFRKAIEESPGLFSAARELASICMIRGDIKSAEVFVRRAFEHAPDNPYIIDILLGVLINSHEPKKREAEREIAVLFERLANVGEEEGRSFYTTRRAEYEYKAGNLNQACKLVDEAAEKTPHIFNVHALRAEIYLNRGNKTVAFDEIGIMKNIVYRGSERRSNLRSLLESEALYYIATGEYAEAKRIYGTAGVFTKEETETAVKALEVDRAFRRT